MEHDAVGLRIREGFRFSAACFLLSAVVALLPLLSCSKTASRKDDVKPVSKAAKLVYVRGGDFIMGDGYEYNNSPVGVTLDGFYISDIEVTQSLYASVMNSNPSHEQKGDYPVENISWYDALEFCNRLSERDGFEPCYVIAEPVSDSQQESFGVKVRHVSCDFSKSGYRLPTEAEWEYACRGGAMSKGTRYSGSDHADDVAWYGGVYGNASGLHSGRLREPNELGIYDMSGNVCEWCWDGYESRLSEGRNPTGPLNPRYHVIRGGSWYSDADSCRITYRRGRDPNSTASYIGMRIAKSVSKPAQGSSD